LYDLPLGFRTFMMIPLMMGFSYQV